MIKITIYRDQRIIIENYQILKEISEKIIIVDGYMIYGAYLKIKQMDDYMIEIFGEIQKIEVVFS